MGDNAHSCSATGQVMELFVASGYYYVARWDGNVLGRARPPRDLFAKGGVANVVGERNLSSLQGHYAFWVEVCLRGHLGQQIQQGLVI